MVHNLAQHHFNVVFYLPSFPSLGGESATKHETAWQTCGTCTRRQAGLEAWKYPVRQRKNEDSSSDVGCKWPWQDVVSYFLWMLSGDRKDH